jgi:hypothetical protein
MKKMLTRLLLSAGLVWFLWMTRLPSQLFVPAPEASPQEQIRRLNDIHDGRSYTEKVMALFKRWEWETRQRHRQEREGL